MYDVPSKITFESFRCSLFYTHEKKNCYNKNNYKIKNKKNEKKTSFCCYNTGMYIMYIT